MVVLNLLLNIILTTNRFEDAFEVGSCMHIR